MDSLLFITFVITSVALIVVPGPNVLVIVSTSISYGSKRGLQTVMGTSSAMVIQLIVAAIGTTWFVESIAEGFEWLRWFGVAYLVYLGVTHILSLVKEETGGEENNSGTGTFARGFIVSLTNPKTILFFSAFLPQFISPNGDYMAQVIILSITFLILATFLDGMYALTASRLRDFIQGNRVQKIQNGVSGLLYLCAGAWLAAMRKN